MYMLTFIVIMSGKSNTLSLSSVAPLSLDDSDGFLVCYRDCLQGAVVHSEEAELRCPYQDDNYACNASLQDREIKAVGQTSPQKHQIQLILNTKIPKLKKKWWTLHNVIQFIIHGLKYIKFIYSIFS